MRKKVKKIGVIVLIILMGIILMSNKNIISFFKLFTEQNNIFTIVYDNISEEELIETLVLRDEQVLGNENLGSIEKIKMDGDRVSKSDNMFRYYSGNEIKILEEIKEIDKKIDKELIEQKINLNSPETKIYDLKMEELSLSLENISNIAKIQKIIQEVEKENTNKVNIYGKINTGNATIQKLIQEKETKQKFLTEKTEIIKAPITGVTSYRIDGYENALPINDFVYLNKNTFNTVKFKTGNIIPESTSNGKIVNNFFTYLTCISKNKEANNLEIGKTKYLKIGDEKLKGEVVYLKNENNERLIVFKLNKGVQELLKMRKINMKIVWWEEEGLKVPREAIKKENNLNYIIKQKSGYEIKTLVKVLKENSDYCLVENYTTEELQLLGIDSSKENFSNNLNIREFDEILLKKD